MKIQDKYPEIKEIVAKIAATHILACIFASFFLGNQLRTVDGTFCALLVEDVDDTHTEAQFLIHVPVDTTESLPVTIEIECLLTIFLTRGMWTLVPWFGGKCLC